MEFAVAHSTHIAPLSAFGEDLGLLSTFLAEAECTKLTITHILMSLVLFLATIAATLLIPLGQSIWLGQGENGIIIFIAEKLMLVFCDLDDEFFRLLFEFFDEIVHDIDVGETSKLVIWVVVLVLDVVVCSGNGSRCED